MNLKTITICFALIIIACGSMKAQTRKDLVGKWDAYAPDAPPVNQKSVAIFTENTASVIIDDSGNYTDSNWMTFKNDTLKFEIGDVSFWLKFESKTKLKGMAKWSEGQTELTMTKIVAPENNTGTKK